MRIVLDTNIVIAAFASRGLCAEVFELCVADHDIIMSEHILSEIEEKLLGKVRLPRNIVQNITGYLRDAAELYEPAPPDEKICRDNDDDKVIGTALAGEAGFIITGDNDLLVLKEYRGIRIIAPRDFWNILRQ